MTEKLRVRPATPEDYPAWRPLWDGYNAFYGREAETALPEHITQTTWHRFFEIHEPMFALLAEDRGQVVGLTHYLYHRSMTRVEPICYLSDLFTLPAARGQGVGRALIEGVYAQAQAAGVTRVYWLTHATNTVGRSLYDKLAKHYGFIAYAADV